MAQKKQKNKAKKANEPQVVPKGKNKKKKK